MQNSRTDWQGGLGRWLEPFLERLGHKTRRGMCPLYIAGLIGPGDRKSVAPMAERFAPGDYDRLHHFVAAGVWDAAPLETELLVQADKLVGGSDAVLVIDDTAMPKKGEHSVGVAPQYASALGKTANCQTLVSLTLARGEVPVTVALRLFLPESWTNDPGRLQRAGVPMAHRTARTKPQIALAELDRMIAGGTRFGCVLADAGYGQSAPFRQELTRRNRPGRSASPSPQGLPCRRATHLPHRQARPSASALDSRCAVGSGRGHAGRCQVAAPSPGVPARRASSRLASPRSACAQPMDRRSASRTRASNICLARKSGSLANSARQASGNTISPTCRPTPTCARWRPPSRRDGSANRRISR